jgi:hypothetical protein
VRVLERDDDQGALLLERATPGTRARDHPGIGDEAIVAVARRPHREPPPGCALPDLGTLRSSFVEHLARFPGDDPLPRRLVDRANQLFLSLLDADGSAQRRVVLHGDLHHDNVLAAERQPWLAIDPLGVIGDRGLDAGAMLYNPDPNAGMRRCSGWCRVGWGCPSSAYARGDSWSPSCRRSGRPRVVGRSAADRSMWRCCSRMSCCYSYAAASRRGPVGTTPGK